MSDEQTFRNIPLDQLREAAQNPRQHFDPKKLEELTASVKAHGVRTPLLVRPSANGHEGYEIGAGHRRFRAAQAAGLAEVPAVVRPMGDTEFLELLTFENLQREDVHPLEEAEGYRALIKSKSGYDVAKIGERVGKSASYVYDRLKLLELTAPAQKLFRDGMITAGHAILLARLTPKDQARAIDSHGALLEDERRVWDPTAPAGGRWHDRKKPVSVREFSDWIDKNVRFDAAAPDPMLFPETAAVIAEVHEEEEKLVPITVNHYVPPEAKDGTRTFGPASWKRADGKGKAKTCPSSVTGVIVVGPGRGEAFKVCTDKKGCAKHWAADQRAAKQRAVASSPGAAAAKDRYALQREKDEREHAREKEEQARWMKAAPAIFEALSAKIQKAAAGAAGALGQLLLQAVTPNYGPGVKAVADLLPRGSSAEDLVRRAVCILLWREMGDYHAYREFPKRAKAFGVDVKKILEATAPAPVSKCRSCGCTEEKACDVGGGRGCSWAEEPDPKTGLGLCSAAKCTSTSQTSGKKKAKAAKA